MAAEDKDLNRDPITNEPGAHPVGTGVGATGGAVAGAAAGAIGGPIGMAVGGIVGAVVGGLAGKAAAEAVNPTAEEAHWREHYTDEPYYEQGRSFDDYGPAYRHGMNARMEHEGDWDTHEHKLASEWQNARSGSGLEWHEARPASRAAWDRVDTLRGGYAGARSGGTDAGSDPAMAGASDGMRGSTGMNQSSPFAAGAGLGGGSSVGMDQDIGGRSSERGMGTTGMESGRAVEDSGMTARTGAMGSDTASIRAADLATSAGLDSSYAAGEALSNLAGSPSVRGPGSGTGTVGASTSQSMAGGTSGMSDTSDVTRTGSMSGSSVDTGRDTGMGHTGVGGAAAKMGEMQSAGNNSGSTKDVIDALQDLVECCKDGEYGFRECAEQAKREDLKTLYRQRADGCRQGAEELNEQIRSLGGSPEHSGSAGGALHRGWVSVKAALSTYDDKAVLEECERGEDNALARYRKALKQPLPDHVKQIVERQSQGVQRNHDQIKMLRDQVRTAG